ncbi:MAG TPA: GDP-mannose pyrophosphatase, partial [Methylovirgula sp.]|nr:GDP-mannose pyrophosphatase [Methylovirgula sp.]
MSDTIKILGRNILHRGFGLLEDIKLWRRKFNGEPQEISREVYLVDHGATILPYDPVRRRVLLVRQFRLAAYLADHHETLIEACAGKLEGKDAATRIVMEAAEELGYAIKHPRFLYEAYMSPGAYTEKISFFVATYSPDDKIGDGGGIDHDEDIEVLEPTFEEALEMVEMGA